MRKTLRASKAGLVVLCPATSRRPEISVSGRDFGAADNGTVAHAIIASAITAGAMTPEEALGSLCRPSGADAEEVGELVSKAFDWFQRERGALTTPVHVEHRLEAEGFLTGGIDVWWELACDTDGTRHWHIVDWKFGHVSRDHYHQLLQYATLLRRHLGDAWTPGSTITLSARMVRLGYTAQYIVDGAEIDAWLEFIVDRLGRDEYRPGDHCGFCSNFATCEPRQAWARSCVAALVATPKAELTAAEKLGSIYPQYLAAKAAVAEYGATLEATLDAGELVPLGDGTALKREYTEKKSIDMRAGWNLLKEAGATVSEITDCARLSSTKLFGILKKRAGKGNGARLERELNAKLAAADAITLTPTRKTVVVGQAKKDANL